MRAPGDIGVTSVLAGGAALCIALGLLDAPERLYYALSTDGVLSGSSAGEIAVAKVLLLIGGAGLALVCAVARLGRDLAWVRRLEEDYGAFIRTDNVAPTDTLLRSSPQADAFIFGVNALVFAGLIQTVHWSFEYHGRDVAWFDLLALESGLWESLTALGLLVGGLLLLWAGWIYRDGFSSRWGFATPCSMGLLFIFGAGEEVSWGQHWLGFDTPEMLRSANTQGEANLHNLYGHWANNLQMVAFLLYLGVLPLVARASRVVRYLCDRLALPVGPLVLVPFAVIGTLLDSRARFGVLWGNPPWRLSEGRETLFGVAILCVAVLAVLDWRTPRSALRPSGRSGS